MRQKMTCLSKQRILCLLAVLMLVITSLPAVSWAAPDAVGTTWEDTTFRYELYSGDAGQTLEARIVGYKGETKEHDPDGVQEHVVNIPSTVTKDSTKYDVTAIGDKAFENNRNITHVNMPDSIVKVGANAFDCCTYLREVKLSNQLTELGENAFFSCTRLSVVTVEADTTGGTASGDGSDQDDGSASGDGSDQGDGSESGDGTDQDAEAASVTLPETLTKLGVGAFYDCMSIRSVHIKGPLVAQNPPGGDEENYGKYAFAHCISLDKVVFDHAPAEISDQMFEECGELAGITLPEGITRIGKRAFYSCGLLTGSDPDGVLTIPKSVTTIDDSAFYWCGELKGVEIPNCFIGNSAFAFCTELTSVVFTEGNEEAADNTAEQPYDIEADAFTSTGMLSIQIPVHVDSIEDGAFANSSLQAFAVNAGNNDYKATDGVLFKLDDNESPTVLAAFPTDQDGENGNYTIPQGTAAIANRAFTNCWKLTNINFPASGLTSIGEEAFRECTELTAITVPDSVTDIGAAAFNYCGSLTDITLPNNLNTIKEYTFEGCGELRTILLPEGLTTIKDGAFYSCYNLGSDTSRPLILPPNVSSISPLAFNYCDMLKDLKIAAANTHFSMEDGILYNQDKTELILCLTAKEDVSVTVPGSVTTIGDYAFSTNNNVKAVILHNGITTIGTRALGFITTEYAASSDRIGDFYISCPGGNAKASEYARDNDIAYFTGTPSASAESVTLAAGETVPYTIKNAPEDSLLFTSSDESIAKVDRQSGTITGVSKGKTYVVASTGAMNFICEITVTSGEKPPVPEPKTEYTQLTAKTYQDWEQRYKENENNKRASLSFLDNSNLVDYTSTNYVAILAKTQGGDYYISTADAMFGKGGYEQYTNVASNISHEMARYTLNENLVLFRGASTISQYTKNGTSRLDDMYASIGSTVKTGNWNGAQPHQQYIGDWVASTSIDHGVATSFGKGVDHTVLEIYAPANYTKGAYLNFFSIYDNETEILLEGGTEFKVLDAGVRVKDVTSFSGDTMRVTERYMKLQITGVKGEKSKDFGTPVVVMADSGGDVPEPGFYNRRINENDIIITPQMEAAGIDSAEKARISLYNALMRYLGTRDFVKENTVIWDIDVLDETGISFPADQYPAGGAKIRIPYPKEIENHWEDYDFTILQMLRLPSRGGARQAGSIEGPLKYEKTDEGIQLVLNAPGAFAIHWKKAEKPDDPDDPDKPDVPGGGPDDEGKNSGDGSAGTGDDTSMTAYVLLLLTSLTLAALILIYRKLERRTGNE